MAESKNTQKKNSKRPLDVDMFEESKASKKRRLHEFTVRVHVYDLSLGSLPFPNWTRDFGSIFHSEIQIGSRVYSYFLDGTRIGHPGDGAIQLIDFGTTTKDFQSFLSTLQGKYTQEKYDFFGKSYNTPSYVFEKKNEKILSQKFPSLE